MLLIVKKILYLIILFRYITKAKINIKIITKIHITEITRDVDQGFVNMLFVQ